MGILSMHALKPVGRLNNIQERAHRVLFAKIRHGHQTPATCCSKRFLHFQRKCRYPSALDLFLTVYLRHNHLYIYKYIKSKPENKIIINKIGLK
jgi:hypothetical protein